MIVGVCIEARPLRAAFPTKSYPIQHVRTMGVSSSVPEKVQASVRSGMPPPQKGTFSAFSALLFFAGAKVFA